MVQNMNHASRREFKSSHLFRPDVVSECYALKEKEGPCVATSASVKWVNRKCVALISDQMVFSSRAINVLIH